jgi:hypothetical protein
MTRTVPSDTLAISEQLASPQHCYIWLGGTGWFRHAPSREPTSWPDRSPVRFTRWAAERLIAEIGCGEIVYETERNS